MSDDRSSAILNSALTFIAGAAVGAIVVALTTKKRGSELRHDLKELGRRFKSQAQDLGNNAEGAWTKLKGETAQAGQDLKHQVQDLSKPKV